VTILHCITATCRTTEF